MAGNKKRARSSSSGAASKKAAAPAAASVVGVVDVVDVAPAPAPTSYSCRAECMLDVARLLEAFVERKVELQWIHVVKDEDLPDVDITFALSCKPEKKGDFDMRLERARAAARSIEDGHVIAETMRATEGYEGERNLLAGTCGRCEHYVVVSAGADEKGCDCAEPLAC